MFSSLTRRFKFTRDLFRLALHDTGNLTLNVNVSHSRKTHEEKKNPLYVVFFFFSLSDIFSRCVNIYYLCISFLHTLYHYGSIEVGQQGEGKRKINLGGVVVTFMCTTNRYS